MSRAAQIARQQERAFCVLRDTVPGTITMGNLDYDVALVTGAASHEQDMGLRLSPDSISFWLRKADYSIEPTLRTAVTHDGTTYYLDEVAGRGEMHQHWRCRAVRHLSR